MQYVSKRVWNMTISKEAMENVRKVRSVLLGEKGEK